MRQTYESIKRRNEAWAKAEIKAKKLIDADELLKRIAEKCKTPSLSEATVNGLCGATAIIYDMLIESEVENADSN